MIGRFLKVVPKTVQLWAVITLACAVVIGLIAGFKAADPGAFGRSMSFQGGVALLAGIFLALWLLSLGFVFADAQRRAMRPVLWTIVAAFFPHLLGFLLYFAMRQPIASTCPECGKVVPCQQPFCSSCGGAQRVSPQPRSV